MVRSASPQIVYALYGRHNSTELQLWQRTWLQGKRHVFIPDEPRGAFAHLYQATQRRGASMGGEPRALFRFRTDANMLWAVHAANASYPQADWVFAVDSDSFVFESTIRARVRSLDPSVPAVIAHYGDLRSFKKAPGSRFSTAETGGRATVPGAAPCTESAPVCRHHNGDGNFAPNPSGCCMCPIVRQPGRGAVFNRTHGKATLRPPPAYGYGGLGVLLSRGLLLPQHGPKPLHSMLERYCFLCTIQ